MGNSLIRLSPLVYALTAFASHLTLVADLKVVAARYQDSVGPSFCVLIVAYPRNDRWNLTYWYPVFQSQKRKTVDEALKKTLDYLRGCVAMKYGSWKVD